MFEPGTILHIYSSEWCTYALLSRAAVSRLTEAKGLFETSGLGLVFGFAGPSHFEAHSELHAEDLSGTSEDEA